MVSFAGARNVEVGGGCHLSSRDAQSVFETILPVRHAAVRLLGCDACTLR